MRSPNLADHLGRACLLAILPFACASVVRAQKGDPADKATKEAKPGYAEALARYTECIARVPFTHHTEGRDRLAQTRSLDGLRILVDDYSKTKNHPEYARYTMATMFGRNFDTAESIQPLNALRLANDKAVDIWLWVKVLRILADKVGDQEVLAIAQTSKNVLHRAAAIAAIGDSRNGNVKAVVVSTCVDFPKKESERNVLLGAMSGALWETRKRVNEQDYKDALTAYIGLLGQDVGLSHTAKVQMGRHLQWILNGPALFINPEPWLELLARGEVKKPASGGTTAAPRFFGIETDGERICYIVDMSDSMLKEIAPSAKPPTAVLTGPKPKKKKTLLDESDLPWHKIKTRWDLAREQLRISLLRLTPDKHFSVVWFGDKSGTLDACKGMIKATKSNIDRCLAELDGINAMDAPAPENGRPAKSGKILRGDTNMHSGISRAFGLAGKGFVDEYAYVNPEALTEGCDTIFLLSDGAPTMDDFYIDDKDYGEGQTVSDHETGAPAPRTPRLYYHGPFDQPDWLVEDLRRMNAFRRIRMHCIGLGEANMGLLGRLAEVGHGEVFIFGQSKDGKTDKSDGGPAKK